MRTTIHRAGLGVFAAVFCAAAAWAADPLTLTSSAFRDGGALAQTYASDDAARQCPGKDVSPPLAWTALPEGTKSLALAMFDIDAARGMGRSHWLAYDIAPGVTGLAEGEASKPSAKFTGGKNAGGTTLYAGPCPQPGSGPHHYIFTLFALDLAPGTLKPGLTRDEFMAAIAGHSLAASSIIGTYSR